MPRIAKSRRELMEGWIEPYGVEFQIVSDTELRCATCSKIFKCSQRQHLVQHINTQDHLNGVDSRNNFNDELCEAFAAANIPLRKLSNPTFRRFLEKYMQRKLPDESTLRKQSLARVYNNVREEIKKALKNKYIWVSVDETTDDMGRRVVNVIVGALEINCASQPFVIATQFFDEINADVITTVVSNSIWNILESKSDSTAAKILLLVTDAAAYMLKAGRQLKVMFPNMLHVTCLAHALHRVCEFIRDEFVDVDLFVSRMKNFFLKSHSRVAYYKELCPDLPLPPQPVTTRWGTWLQAVCFYAENFERIQQTVLTLNDDARSVQECKTILASDSLLPHLQFIKDYFSILPRSIVALEKRNCSLLTAINELNTTISHLKTIPGDFGHRLSVKIENIFDKNPDLSKLMQYATYCHTSSTTLQTSFVQFYAYAPVTSCDVERSFSAYRDILTKKRHHFTEENIEKMVSIYINRTIFNRDEYS